MSYKVQKGDGWYRIAKRQGINVNDLLKANNANLDTIIHPGQMLKMPNQETSEKNTTSKPTNSYYSEVTEKINQALNLPNTKEQFVYGYKTPQKVDLVAKKKDLTDVQTKQAALVAAGYDLGKSGANKDGIDGAWGKKSEAAWQQAIQDGYVYENGRLIKPNEKPNLTSKRSSTASYQYSVNPMFGTPINTPVKKEQSKPQSQNDGYAFYISYPEHSISTKGTGYEWLGSSIPGIKGHAASIIVDGKGNATYHTYGRYGDMGSYITKELPAIKSGEDKQTYLKRIRPHLEYADKNEPVNAAYVPNVDSAKSRAYYQSKPNQGKYSLKNGTTCAGEACRGIDAGTGVDSAVKFDWLIPDTPENVRLINYKGNEQYSF